VGDFSKSIGHSDIFGGVEGRKKYQYPKPEPYDTRDAYAASSLHKKLPTLVNMKKETERSVSLLYDKMDKSYLKEAGRKKGK
jgi:hypothetical protein